MKYNLVKISQRERDEIYCSLGGENYQERERFSLGSQVSFSYLVENILIKGSGVVVGYSGRLQERKIMLMTAKKELITLLFNSKLVSFALLKKSRLNIRRSKIYYIRRSKK